MDTQETTNSKKNTSYEVAQTNFFTTFTNTQRRGLG